jgi:hypothetical protein
LSSIRGKFTFNEDGSIVEIDNNNNSNNGNNFNINSNTSSQMQPIYQQSWQQPHHAITAKSQHTESLALASHFHYTMNKIEVLVRFLAQNKLGIETDINLKYYFRAFMHSYEQAMAKEKPSADAYFKQICTRVLVRKYLNAVLETVRTDAEFLSKARLDNVKLHLNLFLLIKHFLIEANLDKCTLKELIEFTFFENTFEFKLMEEERASLYGGGGSGSLTRDELNFDNVLSLNELFQPFLIEFIHEQEDQFIKVF